MTEEPEPSVWEPLERALDEAGWDRAAFVRVAVAVIAGERAANESAGPSRPDGHARGDSSPDASGRRPNASP